MEQNSGGQGKFPASIQKRAYVVIGIIAVVLIVYFGFIRPHGGNSQNSNTQTNVSSDQNQTQADSGSIGSDGTESGTQTQTQISATTGNVAASGTLMVSDNPLRGNLMVSSTMGNIYISTKRDFSSLLGQPVNLSAQGTINQFTFLGLTGSTYASGVDATARGGVADTEVSAQVSFSGTLNKSDNSARGNYEISSGSTVVYLQTVHNYDSWLNQTVHLAAQGTIDNFTQAVLTQ